MSKLLFMHKDIYAIYMYILAIIIPFVWSTGKSAVQPKLSVLAKTEMAVFSVSKMVLSMAIMEKERVTAWSVTRPVLTISGCLATAK